MSRTVTSGREADSVYVCVCVYVCVRGGDRQSQLRRCNPALTSVSLWWCQRGRSADRTRQADSYKLVTHSLSSSSNSPLFLCRAPPITSELLWCPSSFASASSSSSSRPLPPASSSCRSSTEDGPWMEPLLPPASSPPSLTTWSLCVAAAAAAAAVWKGRRLPLGLCWEVEEVLDVAFVALLPLRMLLAACSISSMVMSQASANSALVTSMNDGSWAKWPKPSDISTLRGKWDMDE